MNVVFVLAQTPYFYNNDGTHGALNDKNWDVITLKLNEEFISETNTKVNWRYHWFEHTRSGNLDKFYLEGNQEQDNYTFQYNYNFNNNHNHTFYTNPITSMKLTSRWEIPFINTYYKDATSGWAKAPKTYAMTTSLAITKNAYNYGFYEARFKVNRPPRNESKGIGQCFWLYGDYSTDITKKDYSTGIPVRQFTYSEIDIAENNPRRSLMTSNYWFQANDNVPKETDRNENDCDNPYISHADAIVNQNEWHTYSLEWTPTEINTYYDNKLVKHMEYPASLLDPMNIILDIEGAFARFGDKHRSCEDITPNLTNLPFDFEIDFVKVYKMNVEGCNTSFVHSNYSFASSGYTYGLKSLIILGFNNSPTASVKVDNGQKISLRAVTQILLEDGFEADGSNGT